MGTRGGALATGARGYMEAPPTRGRRGLFPDENDSALIIYIVIMQLFIGRSIDIFESLYLNLTIRAVKLTIFRNGKFLILQRDVYEFKHITSISRIHIKIRLSPRKTC